MYIFERIHQTSQITVGDKVSFTCNGSGRGGHCNVTVIVTKVNRKTFKATEYERSYRPGTKWNVHIGDDDTYIVRDIEGPPAPGQKRYLIAPGVFK